MLNYFGDLSKYELYLPIKWFLELLLGLLIIYLTNNFLKKKLVNKYSKVSINSKLTKVNYDLELIEKGHISSFWHAAFIDSVRQPLNALLSLIYITLLSLEIANNFKIDIKIINYTKIIGGTVIIIWFALRFVQKLEKYLTKTSEKPDAKITKAGADTVAKLLSGSVIVIGGLIILQTLGFSLGAVLALGGLGGIAISLAAKDFIAGLFGTFMLYFDKPFVVGELVKLSIDKSPIEGIIEKIGWRTTEIRNLDRKLIYMPNIQFTAMPIENISRASYRKIKIKLELMYNDVGIIQEINHRLKNDLQDMLAISIFGSIKLPDNHELKDKKIDEFEVSWEWNSLSKSIAKIDFSLFILNAISNSKFDEIKKNSIFTIEKVIKEYNHWFNVDIIT